MLINGWRQTICSSIVVNNPASSGKKPADKISALLKLLDY